MAGNKDKLGRLHEKLTDVLLEIVEEGDREELSPAMLKVVSGFLKDNDVTCNIEDDDKTNTLRERLREKARRKLEDLPHTELQ